MQGSVAKSQLSPPKGVVSVAIIEDQRDVREALVELVDSTPGLRCCGAYRSGEAAIHGFTRSNPDLALVDLGLPGISGIEAIQHLKEIYPEVHLLVLTIFDDDARIFQALCGGAVGYLLKKTPPAKIMQGIAETVRGGAVMSPAVAKKVIRLFQRYMPTKRLDYHLTAQESRVLRLLVDGHSYCTASSQLSISRNTIATHIKRIYDKLHVHSKSEAVAKAIRGQIV